MNGDEKRSGDDFFHERPLNMLYRESCLLARPSLREVYQTKRPFVKQNNARRQAIQEEVSLK
jgi:hypothetical protein